MEPRFPAGPDRLHEIKQDGYRLIVKHEGKRVRLFTRYGHDGTARFPPDRRGPAGQSANLLVIDGEAVLLGVDGISDSNGLHSRKHDDEVQLYALNILALDGKDSRKLPLHLLKNKSRAAAGAAYHVEMIDCEVRDASTAPGKSEM